VKLPDRYAFEGGVIMVLIVRGFAVPIISWLLRA
jgi:hypothetical protein